ncbi:MAG: VWA domain-containing protein [Bdellovibrionota bacterium]
MQSLFQRLKNSLRSTRAGAFLFVTSLAITTAAVALPQGGIAPSPLPKPEPQSEHVSSANGVKLTGSLSQTKLVQGADGTFYLELAIDTPAETGSPKRTPVDMVVVLDRSGSMAAENRLPYAKSAIKDLLARLTPEDRFGLITFETSASVVSELSPVTEEFRRGEEQVVNGLSPAGSTNMSGGLVLAKSMIDRAGPGRLKKIILLSDGEANLGVIDPNALASIARGFSGSETILSTIGMGLGFNEALMASLADHGMGNFSYLESLASLGNILSKDLEATRSVFASSSNVELRLPAGFRVIDTSGYPSERVSGSDTLRILTGQILSGVRKTLFVTVAAPTSNTGPLSVGDVQLTYTKDGISSSLPLDTSDLALQVVEPARRAEAVASVNQDLFKKSWIANNLGRMQQQFSSEMKAGSIGGAKSALTDYRKRAQDAESVYGVSILDKVTSSTLSKMDGQADDALVGTREEQATKQNRAAKELLVEGRANQGK